jgi:hypothetical protein
MGYFEVGPALSFLFHYLYLELCSHV